MTDDRDHDERDPFARDVADALAERETRRLLVAADPVPGAAVEHAAALVAGAITEHAGARAALRGARQDALDHDGHDQREQVRQATELREHAEAGITDSLWALLDALCQPCAPAEATR